MKTTIYIIRHGEVFNPNKILYGRLPHYKLSEKGIKEIEASASYLANKPIAAMYASPLLRAQQTAEIIQKKLHLPEIITTEQIIEINTSYEGKLFSDLDPIQSDVYLKPLRETDETVEQITERMKQFFQSLIEKYPGKQVVVVSHGDPIMALQATIKKLPMNFHSLRAEDGRTYVQHGEILQIVAEDDNISIASVFKPEVTL